MDTKPKHTLYDEVVNITHEYFGPATDRFVTRQIRNHLQKNPDSLRKQDMAGLINWIKLAMAVINEDENEVNRYVAALKRLK